MQLRQDFAQPVHALAERIEKRQVHRRLRDFQGNARKARAAADIDYALAPKVRRVQKRKAVVKMELRDLLGLGDGR